jgi:thymidylate synthase (FAD)
MSPPGLNRSAAAGSDEAYQELGRELLKHVEWCARISHRSEDAQTAESFDRFLRAVVLGHGDWSVVEHVSLSVDMRMDRGITHELVRHRLASYTQESTRFVNYEKKMPPAFIYPKVNVECPHCLQGDEPTRTSEGWVHTSAEGVSCAYDGRWLDGRAADEDEYRYLIAKGWPPQEARSCLPTGLASRIIVTGNLRNWRHMFIMRTTKQAHPQMRQVMIPLLAEFQRAVPVFYEDITPNASQAENVRLPR